MSTKFKVFALKLNSVALFQTSKQTLKHLSSFDSKMLIPFACVGEMFHQILNKYNKYRTSVIILVAPDCDAICAVRILVVMFFCLLSCKTESLHQLCCALIFAFNLNV